MSTLPMANYSPCRAPAPLGRGGDAAPSALDLLSTDGTPDRAPTSADLDDVMSAMYALLLSDQSSDERVGMVQVQSDQEQREIALQQQKQALAQQARDSGGHGFFHCIGKLLKDVTVDTLEFRFDALVRDTKTDGAACDNPRFWSELEVGAKVVAAVAAAVVTVCTAGAAGPVVVGVALALSATGFAVQQTHCLGGASSWVGAGLTLAGAVVSGGSSLLASGSTLSTSFVQTTSVVTNFTGAGATVVAGAASIEVSRYQADALDAQADAEKAKQAAAFFEQVQQWAIDTLQEQVDSHRNAMNTLASAMQINQQSSNIAAMSLSKG
jgi:hypothetical protein